LGVVYGFLSSSYGLLAAGMNGIAVLREPRLQFLSFADQASARGITGVTEASNGDLWFNGARGVIHVPAQEVRNAMADAGHRIESQRVAEGDFVGPSEMTDPNPSATKDSNGTLWFAMLTGVVSLNPGRPEDTSRAPIVSIRSISADNRILGAGNTVPPKPQILDIQYFGVNLAAPEKVTYKYRLEGLDDTWQEVGRRTEAIYTRVRPGSYVFSVVASNGDGVWTTPVSSMPFRVLPSFYQTWWFATLCGLAALLLAWFFFTLRIRYVTRAIRVRSKERADERVRIARDLHDTLLQGIQGLMLRFHVAAEKTPAGGETRELLDQALDTADLILVEARDRVTRLRATDPADTNLADAFAKVAADLNYEKSVHFALKVEGSRRPLRPVVREELYFVGREAIANAFRHSEASEISVGIKYERAALVITIQDNGCGFHPSNTNNSDQTGHWGLSGMMERAHRVGADFECQSLPGSGTTILLRIPARRAYVRDSPMSRFFHRGKTA
jgi:signal transduction histidine kinase